MSSIGVQRARARWSSALGHLRGVLPLEVASEIDDVELAGLEMCAEERTERDALRAILAPLLDDPGMLGESSSCCRVCMRVNTHDRRVLHHDDCAVLRADELLGRRPPPAEALQSIPDAGEKEGQTPLPNG